MPQTDADTGTCHVCGDRVPVDGEQAVGRFGDVLCADCADGPVVFVAGCQSSEFCDWSHRVEGEEFNRGHLRTRAQQAANRHEIETEVLDNDPMHRVEVHEVSD
jgi:ribosomal protein S27E